MISFLFTLLLTTSLLSATSIDNKISLNKKKLYSEKKQKSTTRVKIKLLAKQINNTNKKMSKLEKDINNLEQTIKKQQKKLKQYKNKLKRLQLKSEEVLALKKKVQIDIVNFIIENYSSELALNLASKESVETIINSNIYTLLANNSKNEIKSLDKQYNTLLKSQVTNKAQIKKIKKFINKDLEDKKRFSKLEKKYNKNIKNLKSKHLSYQKELKKIISKQKKLSSLLTKLNIMKKAQIKKRKKAIKRKAKSKKKVIKNTTRSTKKFNEQIAMNVRNIGSSATGVRVTRYRGSKTIAPLKRYKITKKFGNSYDKVYKIKLFNDSITMQTKSKNAKVYSVLSGKVVYSKKDSGLLENVIIIKHKNNLHTIYSHLDEIAPTIRKGKWVKKGFVIGRVHDTLTFQATKNNRYINPKELF